MVSFATPDFPKKSERLFGADVISLGTPSEFYQMVPLKGFRDCRVAVTNDRFVVSSLNTDVAQLFDENRRSPVSNNRLVSSSLAELSETKFAIFGNRVGRTQIVVLDAFGGVMSRLTVSVKSLLSINSKYFFLTDMLTKKPEGIEAIVRAAAEKVKKVYLNQANVELSEASVIEEVHFDRNLSTIEKIEGKDVKIIYLDDRVTISESNSAGGFATIDMEELLNREVNGPRGGSANKVNVVACWDLELSPEKAKVFPINGSTRMAPPPTNVSLVEIWATTEDNVCIWAHEIGHALGLGHQTETGFLMSKLKGDSWRLRSTEIDQLNPTGLEF